VRRDFLLRVPGRELAETHSMKVDLKLHGADDRLIRETKTIEIDLDGSRGSSELLLQLNLALRSDDRES
jgi:hypothetical protein